MLPSNSTCNVIRIQLIRAGTSIKANVEEADGAYTRPDFRRMMVIARKEAREVNYRLGLIAGKYIKSDLVTADIQESTELIKIFSSIVFKIKT